MINNCMKEKEIIPQNDFEEDDDALPVDKIIDVGDELEYDSVSLQDLGLDLSDLDIEK